jgi:galactose mutarotase-like enzyme
MEYTVSDGRMSLIVSDLDTKLQSMMFDGCELLWQGDEKFWTGYTPVPFHIACGLRGDKYSYHEKTYATPLHGFARSSVSEVASRKDGLINLMIRDNCKTREMYPFSFEFTLYYRFDINCLKQTYIVINTGKEEMSFSLGVHTALLCPIDENGSFGDYKLCFPEKFTIDRCVKCNGLMTGDTTEIIKDEDAVRLNYELFDEAAVILIEVPFKSLELADLKGSYRAKYHFDDYCDLGAWTIRDAPLHALSCVTATTITRTECEKY